jgi:transmembrane sensor
MCVEVNFWYYTYETKFMTKEDYIELYEKCALGEATEKELLLLEEFEDDFSINNIYWDEDRLGKKDIIIADIYKKLQKSIGKKPNNNKKWYTAAAAAILVVGLSILFYKNPIENPLLTKRDQLAQSTMGKAVLTLEDGSQVVLDSENAGLLEEQGIVAKNMGIRGELSYHTLNQTEEVKYNSITIPRGGEYHLVLCDGTKIWLNSESSLKFPMQFIGKDRQVELTGEAYFEVAENKAKPFRVMVKNTEIRVLGTHFNINAYNMVNTTLIEGSVKLKSGVNEVLLKPGEFGVKTVKGDINIGDADIEAVTAWRNGYFVFRDETIKSIMERISRWYDVDIEYHENAGEKEFYGKISRELSLKELLNSMELTGSVKFKIIENKDSGKNKVIVM